MTKVVNRTMNYNSQHWNIVLKKLVRLNKNEFY